MNEPTERRRARRIALWLLYALDVAGGRPDDALQAGHDTALEVENGQVSWPDVESMVRGTHDRLAELSSVVQAVSPRWKVDRMALIDRNILRLGAWEILHGGHSPLAVINACVDLAKEYGDKGTPAFVNGLLDQICRDHQIPIR